MARHLPPRAEDNLPSEPGTSVEDAFLVDSPNTRLAEVIEHIQVGFRFEELPDVHLSIHLLPCSEMRRPLGKRKSACSWQRQQR